MIHRRESISDAARLAVGVALGAAGASRVPAEERKAMPRDGAVAAIPMPLQVVIDDAGRKVTRRKDGMPWARS